MTNTTTRGSGETIGPVDDMLLDRSAVESNQISPARFREALGQFATGVTVITALDEGGRLHGLTANAFSALSLSPPLVLACVNYQARCYPVIRAARHLTIHILAAEHGHIAEGFARKGGDRSEVCDWTVGENGSPILQAYSIALECRLKDIHPGGDHAILVSEVLQIHGSERPSDPLLYYRGKIFPFATSRN